MKFAKTKRWRVYVLLALTIFVFAQGTFVHADTRSYSEDDAKVLAKTVWGEARGCSETQQAAVVWCILNRVDSPLFPNSIQEVVKQPQQFAGYSGRNPVDPEILKLVYDVLSRWCIEPNCIAGVGRVLPPSYLYFAGNGTENRFTERYASGPLWNWSMESPYEHTDNRNNSSLQ